MTDKVTETVTIAAEDVGLRLDRVLATHIATLSRSHLKTLILAGQVTIAARTIRDPAATVKSGDTITVTLPPPEPALPKGETIPLNIIYEDDAIIVIDKPKGLVVHPAAGHASGTLVNALIAHCGASLSGIGGVKRPGIVHRLDKDTTGLMVVAKTDSAHRALSKQFAEKSEGPLKRGYLALVWGAPDRPKGIIDAPIGRHPHARDKQSVRQAGREAVTHWQVLERFLGRDRKPVASLVACTLETGAPTKSGCISPISGTRFLAMRLTAPASGPKPPGWGPSPAQRWRPLADRPCMPIYWLLSTPKRKLPWSSDRNCRAICVVYVTPCTWKAVKPGPNREDKQASSMACRHAGTHGCVTAT